MCDANKNKRGDREDRRESEGEGESSLDSECNITKSESESSLDSECRVDRINRINMINKSKCECEKDYESDSKDKKKHTEDEICDLNLKTRSIGLYNRKPINIIMKGKHYYLKYDGFLYNIPEWAKEINIKQDFTIYHAIGIIEWTVNNKGEGFRN